MTEGFSRGNDNSLSSSMNFFPVGVDDVDTVCVKDTSSSSEDDVPSASLSSAMTVPEDDIWHDFGPCVFDMPLPLPLPRPLPLPLPLPRPLIPPRCLLQNTNRITIMAKVVTFMLGYGLDSTVSIVNIHFGGIFVPVVGWRKRRHRPADRFESTSRTSHLLENVQIRSFHTKPSGRNVRISNFNETQTSDGNGDNNDKTF